jgi:hypothetical protein
MRGRRTVAIATAVPTAATAVTASCFSTTTPGLVAFGRPRDLDDSIVHGATPPRHGSKHPLRCWARVVE